ncbi:plasmid pRiA4b ORF-3 family protein [Stieleria sp. ICT_E10.1]|uniref:plasmid pRiA4b ORF-3 family protein n=1 Tax=Stieleria sedimenti TaxID=2976331 RepID=UPI00217F9830|nr:plasmid pRiA4b ORF-3 family protein [Stieleria sedimenti]MCS7468063.1 plasmid pRiA4b ORF-3 family protein [Stieleria sedimenti]
MKVAKNIRSLFSQKTEPAEKFLRSLSITADQPGPIVSDANALLDFLDGPPTPTGNQNYVLPMKLLKEANQRMAEPLVNRMARPQLRSFPTLAGLYLLLRSMCLVTTQTKPKRAVFVDAELRGRFNDLNPTEQYIALLSAYLFRVSVSIIGYHSRGEGRYAEIASCYSQLDKVQTIRPGETSYLFESWEGKMDAAMLHEFGFVKLEMESDVKEGKSAGIELATRLPLGDAAYVALLNVLRWSSDEDDFYETCRTLFPDLKGRLSPPAAEFQPGEYTLNVSVGDCSRVFVAPAETDLHVFAYAILAAFNFNDEHLFLYEYRDRTGICRRILDGRLDDGEMFADETRLGDLPLESGESIAFDYDFGDTTRFSITIESISDQPSKRKKPEVTQCVGEPPLQYRWQEEYYDDEDDEDDDE